MIVIVDERERKGAIPHMDAAVENNNVKHKLLPPINYEIHTIKTGDYAWVLNGVTVACAERKTWKDAAATLTGPRSAAQHENMVRLRARGVYVFYIIEGPLSYEDDYKIARVPFSSLTTRLRRNMIRGIPYVQVKNQEATAKFVVQFARDLLSVQRELAPDDEFIKQMLELCGKHGDHAVAQHFIGMFSGLGGVTDGSVVELVAASAAAASAAVVDGSAVNSTADSATVTATTTAAGGADDQPTKPTKCTLPVDLSTKAAASDLVIIERVWSQFPDVSTRTAPIMREAMTLYDYFTMDYNALLEKISKLKYPSGSSIGLIKAARIAAAAKQTDNLFEKKKAIDCQRDILLGISGVSTTTADLILAKYTLQQISVGVNRKEFMGLQLGKKKMGPTLTDRIFNIFAKPKNE